MSLEYKVLWVDDNIGEFLEDGFKEKLKSHIESLYFTPHIDFCEDSKQAENFVKIKKYDIIFSDYNISDGKNGDTFIQSIRSNDVNTEILFYTGQSELPQKKFNRTTYLVKSSSRWHDELLEGMKNLISLTVDKLTSLSAIRGLVMAEVSDLDIQMENILKKYYSKNDTEAKMQNFNEHIIKSIEQSLKKSLINNSCSKNCEHRWRNSTFDEIINDLNFDSSKKARTINHIIKESDYVYETANNFYEDYLKEIISVRNNLAHCSSCNESGKEMLKTKKGNLFFTKESVSEIRKNILKYKNIFDDLESKIE